MILLNNLTSGSSYTARVAALTRVGLGPYSGAVPIYMDPTITSNISSSIPNFEYWIFILLILFVLILIVAIIVLLYLKKRQHTKKNLSHFDGKFSKFDFS